MCSCVFTFPLPLFCYFLPFSSLTFPLLSFLSSFLFYSKWRLFNQNIYKCFFYSSLPFHFCTPVPSILFLFHPIFFFFLDSITRFLLEVSWVFLIKSNFSCSFFSSLPYLISTPFAYLRFSFLPFFLSSVPSIIYPLPSTWWQAYTPAGNAFGIKNLQDYL